MAGVKLKMQRQTTPMPDSDPLLLSAASRPSAVVGYLASLAMTALTTAVAIGVDSGVSIPNISLLFVVPVVVAGVAFGLGPSFCSAAVGALAYNFFLTEPRYSLTVDDPAYIWAIGLLFLVGLIVSGVAFTSRLRATDAAVLRGQVNIVQGYSRAVLASENEETLVSITTKVLAALFQIPVVVMLFSENEVTSVNTAGSVDPLESEFEAARASLETGTVARAGIYPSSTSRFDFWPVTTARGRSAVIGLAFEPSERPSAGDPLVDTIRSVLALALDRQQLQADRS
jgi:K+-sensing histidine kinase KdpD